jgi:hypothetical protein
MFCVVLDLGSSVFEKGVLMLVLASSSFLLYLIRLSGTFSKRRRKMDEKFFRRMPLCSILNVFLKA